MSEQTLTPVNNVTPASPIDQQNIDLNGFTAEDRAEAQRIYTTESTAESTPPVEDTTEKPEQSDVAAESTNDLNELGKVFGIEDGNTASLDSFIDVIAKAGESVLQEQPVNTLPPPPESVSEPEPELDEETLANVPPEFLKMFKGVVQEAKEARKIAEEARQALRDADERGISQGHQQVLQRADAYIDSLKSSKYGVSGSRSAVQRIELETLHKLAGNIISGLARYGSEIPPIERVMQAAFVRLNGTTPKVSGTPAASISAPPQQVMSLGTPPTTVRSQGSTGSATSLMADPEFINAARAIING